MADTKLNIVIKNGKKEIAVVGVDSANDAATKGLVAVYSHGHGVWFVKGKLSRVFMSDMAFWSNTQETFDALGLDTDEQNTLRKEWLFECGIHP